MKWAVVAVALAALLPLASWLRRNPNEHPKVWMLIGALPFLFTSIPLLEISPTSWPAWPGYVKGTQFTLLDFLALAMFVNLPRSKFPLPFKLSMALYFGAVVLSMVQAQVPMAASFYVWQLARVFLVYAVVARACADERVAPALLKGMAIGVAVQACMVIWQRFGLGVLQASGGFGHQNLLSLVSHFAVFPVFALLLAGQPGWQSVVAPLAGAIIAVLTASRAAVGLTSAGLLLMFLLSAVRKWTPTKAKVALVGVVAVCVLAPIAVWSLQKRFADVPISQEYDERAAFERAASMILADHPMGVGANNYVVVANAGGYMDRAGVAFGGSRTTFVHNAYWLTAAETGYFGFFAFVLLLLRVVSTALACGWRNRGDPRGDLLLGLGVSLTIVAIHINFEWVFFYSIVQYLFAINAGLVGGLAQQLRQPATATDRRIGSPRVFGEVIGQGPHTFSNSKHLSDDR